MASPKYFDRVVRGNWKWRILISVCFLFVCLLVVLPASALSSAAGYFAGPPATVTISGTFTNVNNRGINGITVKLSDGATQTTQTDANGKYSFSVATGLDYTVTPSDPRVSDWTPTSSDSLAVIDTASISHTNLQANVVDNFKPLHPTFVV